MRQDSIDVNERAAARIRAELLDPLTTPVVLPTLAEAVGVAEALLPLVYRAIFNPEVVGRMNPIIGDGASLAGIVEKLESEATEMAVAKPDATEDFTWEVYSLLASLLDNDSGHSHQNPKFPLGGQGGQSSPSILKGYRTFCEAIIECATLEPAESSPLANFLRQFLSQNGAIRVIDLESKLRNGAAAIVLPQPLLGSLNH